MITNNQISNGKYWLCPLYSLNCDCENIDLEEGVKIQRIPSEFVNYLNERFGHSLKTIPSSAKWVALLPFRAKTNRNNNTEGIFSKLFEEHERATNLLMDLTTTLRLTKKGRLVVGILTSARLNNTGWSIGGDTI